MSKRAIVYCRISKDREGRRLGVQRQEEDCRLLADRLDYAIAEVLIENDTGASTRSRKPRPEFEKLMTLAEAGDIDAILAYSSSRLTRRPMENERLIHLYETTGTLIHYVNAKDNDLSTARGRSRARDDARRDAEEAEEISERVERDVRRRAREGVPHGGQRAFGWTVDQKLDPYEHRILLDLVERALAGESVRSLARDLEARGVPQVRWHPPLVIKWQVTTIRKMLTNPRIAGLRAHKGKVIGKAEWPAVVGEDTWRQLVALFDDPARNTGGSTGRVNLLTGLAHCGECDRLMSMVVVHARSGGRRDQYACKHCGLYRKMDQVDAYVEGAVVEFLEHLELEPDPGIDPAVLKAIEQLRSRIEATKREFADDDTVTPQELREMLRHLRGRLQAEESKLARSRRGRIVGGLLGAHAMEQWGVLGLDRKRAVIDALVEIRLHRTGPGPQEFRPETVQLIRR